jgi:hypothetical protein
METASGKFTLDFIPKRPQRLPPGGDSTYSAPSVCPVKRSEDYPLPG